jgi:hypothetical protein
MSALTTAEAASVGHPRFRPEAHESALKFLRQELLEDRPRRITISRRIVLWTPPGPTTQPYGPLRCSR